MKNTVALRRGLKILSALLAVVVVVQLLQVFVFRSRGRDAIRADGFVMQPENSLDVVLVGASEIFTGFASCRAYEQYGFTSYPYSISGAPVWLFEALIEEVRARQNPQLIIVDINPCSYWDTKGPAPAHYMLDGMPLSLQKLRLLQALPETLDEPAGSYLFPISKYHSTWSNGVAKYKEVLDLVDLHRQGTSLLKGVYTENVRFTQDAYRDVGGDNSTEAMDPVVDGEFRAFLDYCGREKLPLLFVRFPHQIGTADEDVCYTQFRQTNLAAQLVQEAGFPYEDMQAAWDEIGLDPDRDFYNREHLNLYGQLKTTDYLAKLLVEKYGVSAQTQPPQIQADWECSAAYYQLLCQLVAEADGQPKQVYFETRRVMAELRARTGA